MSDPLDLFVLVADLDALNTVNSLLKRSESLGIRSIQFDILKLNDHDSALFSSICRLFTKIFKYT